MSYIGNMSRKKRIALLISMAFTILAIIAGVVCAVTFGKNNQHTYDQEVVDVKYLKTAATCERGAVYYKSCECGEASDETFEYGLPLGHDYGTLIAEDPATCTESGVKAHYHCTRCAKDFNESKQEATVEDLTIAAKGHDYGTWIDGKPATETEDGEKGHYHCPDCGKNFDNDDGKTEIEDIVIPPVQHKHEYTQEVATETYLKSAATCTTSAVYYKSCECGKSSKDESTPKTFESGTPNGHDYGAWISNGNGTHTKTCSHDASHTVTEDCSGGTATCTEQATCKDCNEKYGTALGHDYGDWVSNGDGTHTKTCSHDASHTVTESCSGGTATCTEQATCKDCNEKYGTALGHDYGDWASNGDGTHTKTCSHDASHTVTENCSGGNATCTEQATCKDCNAKYGTALGHDYGEWTSNNNGTHSKTCTREGCNESVENHTVTENCSGGTATCTQKSVCEHCHVEYGNYGEHTYAYTAAKEATCTEDGNYEYYYCSACETYFDKDKNETTLSALTIAASHTYGSWIEEDPATCTEPGVKAHKDCTVCKKHFDNDGNEIEDLTIVASGHNYGSWIDEDPATCTEDGVKAHKDCTVCKKHFDNSGNEITDLAIDANGHNYGTWIEEIPATEESTGIKGHYHCSVCSKNFDAEYKEIDDLIIQEKEHEHLYVLEVTTNDYLANAATCEASAVYYKSCRCGACGEDTFTYGDPLGHRCSDITYEWDTTYTSCTATRICGECSHKETADGTVGDAITQPLTCTANELTTYTATFTEDWCTDQTETVTTALATGHSFGEVSYEWNSTYTSCTAIRVCADDSNHIERTTSTKVTSNRTQELTCMLDEITTYTATFDKDWCETQTKEATSATAKGHVYQNVVKAELLASAATCTSPAKYYKSCTCGAQNGDTFTYGSALNHDYGETQYDWSSDNLTCTATRTCGRSGCGHSEEETVDTVKTVTQAVGCEQAELSTFTATFKNTNLSCSTKTGVQTAEATGHTYGEWIEEVAATCTKTGTVGHYYCSACKKYFDADKNEIIDGITITAGHDYSVFASVGDGTHTKKCSSCNSTNKTVEQCVNKNGDHVCDICGGTKYSEGLKIGKRTDGSGEYRIEGAGTCSDISTLVIPEKTTDGVVISAFTPSAFAEDTTIVCLVFSNKINTINEKAFYHCSSLTTIYFVGTEAEFNKISIKGSNNQKIKNATKYYYSEDKPSVSGKYWHYDNGYRTVWNV